MRKVLSFVLVLSLVLGSFSMAFAATPATGLSDIDGNANEQAIEVAYNLGIVTGNPDGTFLPAKAVNRAEFAAMITRALNIPDSALAGYTSTSFKDTVGYGWAVPYLAFCQSKGIMLGDGMGNVMPGRTINTNEAVTMALRAIGYTNNSSKLVGVWPANYVTLAQTEGLYDSVSATTNVDKANAAQIIYNLMTVGLVQVNADGETVALGKSVTEDGVTEFVATTLLTANHGAVADDEVVMYEDDAMINTLKYVGDYATVYRDKDDDNIIAIGKIKSTMLDGEITEGGTPATTIGAADLKIEADDVTYTLDNYEYFDIDFLNADPDQGFTLDNEDKYIFNVKLQGKKIVTVYSIEKWTADETGMAADGDLSDIEDGKLLGFDFATDKNDEIIGSSFELIGAASLESIEKDDVVYVYEDASANEIRRVAVGTDVVEGKVTKISGTTYTVAGTGYKFSSATGTTTDRPGTGDSVKLYLDAFGKIYDYESTDAKADTYAVVIATGAGVDGNRVRVFDAEAADDKVFSYTSDASEIAGFAADSLIGYALNKDGKINDVELATVSGAAMELVSSKVLDDGPNTYPVATDAVVITFDGTDYGTSSISKIQTDGVLTQAAVSAQAILDDGVVVALLVDEVNAGKNADDVYAVINTVDEVYDETQDEDVQNVVGFADGVAMDKNTNDILDAGNFATEAALYKIIYDGDGYIKDITPETAFAAGVTIAAVKNSNFTVQLGTTAGAWAQIADNAVVYRITDLGDADDMTYSVSSVSGFKAPTSSTEYTIWLYETDDDSEGYDVVFYTK